MEERATAMRTPWVWIVLAAALLAFSPALRNEFALDDVAQVRDLAAPKTISAWITRAAEPWWPAEKEKNVWRPLTQLLIAGEKVAFAPFGAAWPYHIVNLLLHVASCMLFYFFLRELSVGATISGLAATIAAVHPLRSEAVHQVVGQAEILALIWMLFGMCLHTRRRRWHSPYLLPAAHGIIYFLALASKEHAILYPVYLLLIEAADRRSPAKSHAAPASRQTISVQLALTLALGVFLCTRYAVVGALVESRATIPHYENVLATAPFIERVSAAFIMLAFSLIKFLIPLHLSPDYSAHSIGLRLEQNPILAVLGADVSAASIWVMIRSWKAQTRTWAWVLGGLLAWGLISNLLIVGGVAYALRLLYFPLLAPCLGLAWAWVSLIQRSMFKREAYRWVAILLLPFLYTNAAWRFAWVWRDDFSLAAATFERYPDSWRANHNLALEYYERKEFEAGLKHARHATELETGQAQSWDLLGLNAMFLDGHESEARRAFDRALQIDPSLAFVRQHRENLERLIRAKMK